MRKLLVIGGMIILQLAGWAQSDPGETAGKVTYRNSRNIYVKFSSTETIAVGDTLFLLQNGALIPAAIVDHKSSISCVCTPFSGQEINVDTPLIHRPISRDQDAAEPQVTPAAPPPLVQTDPQEAGPAPGITQDTDEISPVQEQIRGRVSMSYYGTMSDREGYDRQRMRYTFSFRGQHLGDSRFSAESYVSYRHTLTQPTTRTGIPEALKVYNLAIGYDASRKTTLWAGRRYNPNISNIGAIDGLQFESALRNLVIGGFAG
ncbi:MAG: hypothetical protein R3330_01475, partial [Saprospiraceae bacterium]|nr:hypothetical protein [Saprospiraceae bacterium]